jgi:hypothetical protein
LPTSPSRFFEYRFTSSNCFSMLAYAFWNFSHYDL